MSIHLALLFGYLVVQVALGLWISRKVTTTGDFFVAVRSLGPGVLFSTLVAANSGAGSTVGAAGLGYRDGLHRQVILKDARWAAVLDPLQPLASSARSVVTVERL